MKTQSSGQNRNANAASKLEHVAERFQAFYNDLEQEKQQRRLSENARFHQLQDLLCKIERGLEAEVRRRSEADKKLQGHLDVELRRLQDRLSDEMREWQETMKASVDGLSKDVAAMQKSLRDEKEERDAEIESLTQSLSSRIEECTVGLEDERVSRLEREAQTLKRIGEDISRIQQRIDDDGSQRDAALVCVKNEVKEATSRATGESKFQSTILEEMKSVRTSLKSETEARISEDDAIITAINEYTRALQQGLRLNALRGSAPGIRRHSAKWRRSRIRAESSSASQSMETQKEDAAAPALIINGAESATAATADGDQLSGIKLDIREVKKTYVMKDRVIEALYPVTLHVKPCSKIVFLGPSGSGKTTLLRLISGLESPTSGRILFDDVDVTDMSVQDRNLGFVFQNYALFKHMNVAENIAFGLRMRKLDINSDKRVAELLKLVELDGFAKYLPRELSGGQRQRVAMARALACSPRLLLLDEPFGALDVVIRRNLRQSMKDIADRLKLTTLMVTHDQEEAFDIADEVVIFNRGKVEQIGTPDEIQKDPQTPFVMSFIGDVNMLPSKSLFVRRLRFKTEKPEVMVRPEDLHVSTEIRSEFYCPAIVADRYDMGYMIKYVFRFDDDEIVETLATREEAATTKNYPVLSRVYMTANPSKMMGFFPEEIEYFR